MEAVWVLAAAALLVGAVALSRGNRRRRLEQYLTAHWGNRGAREEPDRETIEEIAAYWRCLRQAESPRDAVDDITWNDLEMDAVFARLDYAESGVGEEALYAALRQTGVNGETLEARKRFARAIEEHPDHRLRIRALLHQLGRSRAYGACAYLFRPSDQRVEHGFVYPLLAALPVAVAALGFFRPAFLLGLIAVFGVNAVVYYLTQKKWQPEVAGVRQLAAMLKAAGRLRSVLPPEMSGLAERLGALYAEMKPMARWNALFAMQRQSDLDFLTDYLRILFQLDMLCLIRLTAFFRAHNAALRELYALIGELDACVAIAAWRASGVVCCEPEYVSELCVRAEGLTHPLLRHPVPNDIVWDRGALITGSNASGKSTFTKALAVNAILAQSVCLCTAQSFRLPRARVATSMAMRDDLLSGESYFIVEIRSIRRIVEAVEEGTPTLCFIDEILRGTNTVERIAASCALLNYLQGGRCLCMAATHDQELTTLLKNYRQLHFREEITPSGMSFTYQLHEGPADTRNAIRLLTQMRFPEALTQEALALANRFDRTRRWTLNEQESERAADI